MPHQKSKDAESPGGATQPNPDANVKQSTSKRKTSDDKKERDLGVSGGNPLIQVTRASYSTDAPATAPPGALQPTGHAAGQRSPGGDPTTTGRATEDTKAAEAAKPGESPGLDAHATLRHTASSASLLPLHEQEEVDQLHHPQRPLPPGVAMEIIGWVLFCPGAILVVFHFTVFGGTLCIFGGLVLLCGSVYLVQCWIERYIARRHKHYREIALSQGPGWLTKPPVAAERTSVKHRALKKRSSAEISTASEERVEVISDLNSPMNGALLPTRENNAKNVTKATVAMPKSAKQPAS